MPTHYPRASIIGLFALMLLTLGGCQATRFYQQAIVGHSQLMLQRQSTEKLRTSGAADPALHARLDLVDELLAFAVTLGLPPVNSYRTYVETGQPFVIWNVFASRPYELKLKQSCFPVAGCVSYRGYFQPEAAYRYAGYLKDRGWEVYVGGVTAYSTLGWFDDPLLDTFLFQSDNSLAALIFHELAHQVVYVPGDTRFNESVATTIERYALQAWLQSRRTPDQFVRYQLRQQRRDSVLALINDARDQLRLVYATDLPDEKKAIEKQAVIAALVRQYHELAAAWGDDKTFRTWMDSPINNPKLETVADYNQWVPVLKDYLERVGMAAFETEMQRLATLDPEARVAWLKAAGSTLR